MLLHNAAVFLTSDVLVCALYISTYAFACAKESGIPASVS